MKLEINNLEKIYDGKSVLKDINLKIENFNVLAFIGASGSGKSTLLRLIAGLEQFEGGNIILNDRKVAGEDLSEHRKNIGFVFQDHNLFNHLSVMENLLLVLEKVHKKNRSEVTPMLMELLTKYDLVDHKDKLPHQLSGGQSQRVSIVRALSINPELILLDEPTSSLDPILTYEVLDGIKKLVLDNKDFVLVTHEIGFAKNIADYIVFMDDGKIVEHGPSDILDMPESEKLKDFLDKILSFHVKEQSKAGWKSNKLRLL